MRISIESTEPLEDVIRVVGAAYNVTLTVATTNEATTSAPAATTKGRGRSRTATDKAPRARSNGRGRPAQRDTKVSNDDLRSWARENGHTVSDRGRIPMAVVAAYRDAQAN